MSPVVSTRAGASANAYGWGAASAVITSFESIATATGTGASATITFSSIPSTFKHLQIRGIGKDTFNGTGSAPFSLTFNGDSATNYSRHLLRADTNTTAANSSESQTSIQIFGSGVEGGAGVANMVGVNIIDILDYTNTNKYKTTKSLSGNIKVSAGALVFGSGLWQSTSAITSISIIGSGSFFSTQSAFALYGIKEAV